MELRRGSGNRSARPRTRGEILRSHGSGPEARFLRRTAKREHQMTDVLLAGDFYVGRGFEPAVDESVCKLIKSAGHALVNLEAPITHTTNRIEKTGPHLTMPVSSLD